MIQNREFRLVLMGKSLLIDYDQEEYLMPREKLDYLHLNRIDIYRHSLEVKFCDVRLEVVVRDFDQTDEDDDVWSKVNYFREALALNEDVCCELTLCADKHGIRENGVIASNQIEESKDGV